MRQKVNSKKGFTLAELLIVVAIIAVLVAIMIPVFGQSRARAILAKDVANLRSAYAEKLMIEMGKASYTGSSVTVSLSKSDIDGKWESKADGGGSAGTDITVTSSSDSTMTETIYVDDDVTVTIADDLK